jgi:HlyD family secretion protein
MSPLFRLFLCLGLFFSLLLCATGCEKKAEKKTTISYSVVVAKPKSTITELHFNGTLGPLAAKSVLSPLDGRVTHIYFQYGQQIQKGQLLITLDATKLSEEYRKTVSDYLEKKQNYQTGLMSFRGTEALYKAGVISAEEYSTALSRQNNDTLSYYQAKYDLEKLLPQTNLSVASIEQLNLNDLGKVNSIINRQFREIKVTAPTQGIALFPTPEQKKDTTGSGRIAVGDELKDGQLILSIGDLSGFSMKIFISEINVNLIKPNLTAKVTGDAFPGVVLPGYVVSVASQASPQEGNDSGLGMFEANIQVTKVSPEHQRTIRFGMKASVELYIT